LRGRVGRGSLRSYCFLESATDNDLSIRRLEVMERTTDGFKISEEDLKLRNSGEIFGTKQSGVSDLMLIDIIKNVKEIKEIRDFVLDYLERYRGMVDNEYLKLDIYEKFHKKAETST
jgi:ATP-dependent DNA helicase RecG